MPTGTAGSAARQYETQQVHYLRRSITFADHGLTLTVGTIPAGALVLKALSGVHVTTAFNAAGADTLDIGPSTDSGTDLWATALDMSATNFIPMDENVSLLVTVDTIVQCDVTASGATAGAAEVIICYIPDNDQ
jgi:hypothetical protein